MEIKSHILEALGNLAASKLRSVLAVLGILVGTASVVAMVSAGQLATEEALKQFKLLGTNLLSVAVYPRTAAREIPGLELKQALNIKTLSDSIISVSPYIYSYETVAFQGKKLNARIVGVTDEFSKVLKITLASGRNVMYLDKSSLFAAIGHDVNKELKQRGAFTPLGKQLQIGNSFFTIIGVFNHWPSSSFFPYSIDRTIIIPIKSLDLLREESKVNNIVVALKENSDIEKIQKRITTYVNQQAPTLDVYVRSAQQIIESRQAQARIFTLLLALIGSISLLVGGIGVMNIMLVSVTERKKEIGIRRAIGARRRDIQSLFLAESVLLSLLGGTMGVILGIGVSYVITIFAQWEFTLFVLPPVIGFVVSVAVGIFFGFYPAYKASRLDPIETLRAE